MKKAGNENFMKAAVFKGAGKLEIEKIPVPEVKKKDDVLFKVEACSICGTDLSITSIPQKHVAGVGTILGHEYIGKVIDIGSEVGKVNVGDRVVPNSMTPCGMCQYCNNGFPNLCAAMVRLGVYDNGGFAEYSLLPERALFKVSQELSPELGVLIEPLACEVNSLREIGFLLGKNVVVLGGGPMGQLFVQMIKKSGAGLVLLSEISELRRNLGIKNGADFIIDPQERDFIDIINKKMRGGVDIVIDVVGSLFEQALKIVKKTGMVVLFGNDNTAVATFKPSDILLNEIKILNTFAVRNSYLDAMKIVESGLLDSSSIITKKISLEELMYGFELLRKQLELKIMVEFE